MPAIPMIPAPFYSVVSSNRPVASRYPRSVSAIRKFAQGAGSALLVFAGADSITGNAEASGVPAFSTADLTSFEGIAQSLVSGSMTGPLQIVAAAFLFLAAGRCLSRFLGLAVGAVILILYLQGVTVDDAWSFVEHFAQRLSAAAAAFQTAEVA